MKIVAITIDYPPARWIGSEVGTHELLRVLVDAGHHVTVACPTKRGADWTHDGIAVRPGPKALHEELAGADVVIAHVEMGRFLRRHQGPKIGVTHNGRRNVAESLEAWQWDLLVHNAEATAQDLASSRRCPWIVVHPPVRWKDWQVKRPGADAITLVNVTGEKGSDTFYELARRMPDRNWIGVLGGWGEPDVRDLPGVTIVPHGADMRAVYARTRILLMPSEHESWGRVAVEAMASGIPVLATDLPGPREAIGKGGVLIELDWVDEYQRQIELLDDPKTYEALSRAAAARAKKLDPAKQLEEFVQSVEALAAGGTGPWRTDGVRTFRHRSGRRITVAATDPRCARYDIQSAWEEVPDGRN